MACFTADARPNSLSFFSEPLLRRASPPLRAATAPKGMGVRQRDLQEAVDDLLAHREVRVAETDAFGCSIVR